MLVPMLESMFFGRRWKIDGREVLRLFRFEVVFRELCVYSVCTTDRFRMFRSCA